MKINFTWSEMTKGGKILFSGIVALMLVIITCLIVYLVQPVIKQVVPNTVINEVSEETNIKLQEDTATTDIGPFIDDFVETAPLVVIDDAVNYYPSQREKWAAGVAGEIYIPNTQVKDYVVQWIDNSYYLDKNIEGNEDVNGSLFLDYRNTGSYLDKNNIIYGHNMRSGVKFGTLSALLREDRYTDDIENWYIYLNTRSLNTRFKVYSVYTIDLKTFNYIQVGFEGDEFANFVENTKYYNQLEVLKSEGENVDSDSTLLTLSTCVNGGTHRLVVHAYLVDSRPI